VNSEERFKGFPVAAHEFLEDLEMHNERAWFHEHKDLYERACRRPMELLLAELAPLHGAGRVYRIQRDVRFSNDKTPYKTFVAASFGNGYLSLSPAGFYVGTGGWMLEPPLLTRYREAAADDKAGPALERIIATLRKKGYDVGGHGELKVVPRGYPRDHPRAELLKQKSVLVGRTFPIESWLATRKTIDRINKVLTDAGAMNEWLATHVVS